MIAEACWPNARTGEALFALAEAAGLEPRREPSAAPVDDDTRWLLDAAGWADVGAEPVAASYADVPTLLAACAPALVRTRDGVLAVVAARRGRLHVLAPDGRRARITIADVATALRGDAERSISDELDKLAAAVAPARRPRLRAALCTARLAQARIEGVTLLRRAVHHSPAAHARDQRFVARLVGIALAYLAAYVLALLAWWLIGRTIFAGTVDRGWLAAWALTVASAIGLRLAATAGAGALAIDASTLLRERLLVGALRLPPEIVRGDGVGRALGRTLEASALEQLAISGGFTALFAAIEVVVVIAVLAAGAGGWLHVALYALVLALAAVATRRYFAARQRCTDERLALTHGLVDAMLGHATRLAQLPPDEHHLAEDRSLARYARHSEDLDRQLARLQTAMPAGWLVIASIGLMPAWLAGQVAPASLAIAFGGMLLGQAALAKLADAGTRLGDAAIAWRSIAPLVTAAGEPPLASSPALAAPSPEQPVVAARGIVYRAPRGNAPVLAGCDLVIRRGDRIVLEGMSGAGKSTFARVLAGLARPDAGLVLAGGLDRVTLGEQGWRRRIVLVPQFHENHIFVGPLAFNLLMGRAWPPAPGDVQEAEELCRELGLGPTIDRMPAGIGEMVGETGWQLSHGEKSRVFLARALLSRAQLVVLDESLAALDPETLVDVMACIERRAVAALVIAHP